MMRQTSEKKPNAGAAVEDAGRVVVVGFTAPIIGQRSRPRRRDLTAPRRRFRRYSVINSRSIGNSPIFTHVREPCLPNSSTLASTNSLLRSICARGSVPV